VSCVVFFAPKGQGYIPYRSHKARANDDNKIRLYSVIRSHFYAFSLPNMVKKRTSGIIKHLIDPYSPYYFYMQFLLPSFANIASRLQVQTLLNYN